MKQGKTTKKNLVGRTRMFKNTASWQQAYVMTMDSLRRCVQNSTGRIF
jgi:hypothetical protein